jgi:hypothetical protein
MSSQPVSVGTIDCTNCVRYVALVPNPAGGALRLHEYERDGFTVSDRIHVCAPRGLAGVVEVIERGEQQ